MAINRRRRRRKKDVFEPEEYMPKQVISFTDLEESLKDDGEPGEDSNISDELSSLEVSSQKDEKGLEEKLADFRVDQKLLSFSEADLSDASVESAFIFSGHSSGKKEEKHTKAKEDLKESKKLEEFLKVGDPSEGLGFAELSTSMKAESEISDEETPEEEMEESLDLEEEEDRAFKISMDIFSVPQTDFKTMLTENSFQDDLLSQFEEEEEEIISEEIIEEEVTEEAAEADVEPEPELIEEKIVTEETQITEETSIEEIPEAHENTAEEAAIEEVTQEYSEEAAEFIPEEETPESDETMLEESVSETLEEESPEIMEAAKDESEYSEEGETIMAEEAGMADEKISENIETEIPVIDEIPDMEEIQSEETAAEVIEEEIKGEGSVVETEILHLMENKFADEISGIRKQIGDVLLRLNTLDDIREKMKGPIPDLKAYVEQLASTIPVESVPEVIEIPMICVPDATEDYSEERIPEEALQKSGSPLMPQVKVSMEKEISVFGDLIRSVPALYFLKPRFSKVIFEPDFGYKELAGLYRLAARYLKQEMINAQRNIELLKTQFLNYKNQGAQLDFLLGSEEKPGAAVTPPPVDEGELFTLKETIKKKDNLIGRQQIQLDKMHLDFANSRARQQKDIDHKVAKFQESIVSDLLKVVDDFELSMNFARQGTHDKNLIKGFNMTFEGLRSILKKFGLEEIPAMGEKFDPNIHESLMNEETNRFEDGYVMQVLRKGYTLNENVLRPTQVKVASNSTGIVVAEEPAEDIELDSGMANGYQELQGSLDLNVGMADLDIKSGGYELDSGMAKLE